MSNQPASIGASSGCDAWSAGAVLDRSVLTAHAVLTRPLEGLNTIDRSILRTLALFAARGFDRVEGGANILPDRDPFILALNHTCRREAILVPALLVLLRRGRRLHMLADWNFKLIPGAAFLYARSGTITVDQKRARPRWLEVLRPYLVDAVPAHDRASAILTSGRSIGMFPEGTVNRHPTRLLQGRRGAAQLSVETGAPIVPAGICRSREGRLNLTIGAALLPSPAGAAATHTAIMQAIADLSGKSWRSRS